MLKINLLNLKSMLRLMRRLKPLLLLLRLMPLLLLPLLLLLLLCLPEQAELVAFWVPCSLHSSVAQFPLWPQTTRGSTKSSCAFFVIWVSVVMRQLTQF